MNLLQRIIGLFRPSYIMYHDVNITTPNEYVPKLRNIKLSKEDSFDIECIYNYKTPLEMTIDDIHDSIVHNAKFLKKDILHIQIPLIYKINELRNNIIPKDSEIHMCLSREIDKYFVTLTIHSLKNDTCLEELLKLINIYKAFFLLEKPFNQITFSRLFSPFIKHSKEMFKDNNITISIFNSALDLIYASYPIN